MDAHGEQREHHQRDGEKRCQYSQPCQCEAYGADDHNADFRCLDVADYHRLVAHVGELAGQRGEQEEGQDEHGRSDAAEDRFRFGRIVDAVDDEQHHRILVQIVVERVEKLRREERQKPALLQQMCGCEHAIPCGLLSRRAPDLTG